MAAAESEPICILVTGFGPFDHFVVNPSWLAVKPLHNTILYATSVAGVSPRPIHITVLLVPAVYQTVLDSVPGMHARPPVLPEVDDPDFKIPPPPKDGYAFIMHCGVAGPRPLRLETQAHKYDYPKPDADGRLCPVIPDLEGVIRGFGLGYEKFPELLKNDLDTAKMKAHLDNSGVVGSWVSYDPGHYVCDFTYYCSLAQALVAQEKYGLSKPTPVFFLHLPPVGEPMTTEEVTIGIQRVIEWVGAQL